MRCKLKVPDRASDFFFILSGGHTYSFWVEEKIQTNVGFGCRGVYETREIGGYWEYKGEYSDCWSEYSGLERDGLEEAWSGYIAERILLENE